MAQRAVQLGAIGIWTGGLDAFPAPDTTVPEGMKALRADLRAQLEAVAGEQIRPLGPESPAPRQFVVEAQLGLAIDQGALARRLVSPLARDPVRRLAAWRMALCAPRRSGCRSAR